MPPKSENMTRTYSCEYYTVKAYPMSCFFCRHCTDIFFDYTHGPYMFMCELDLDVDLGLQGKCDGFEEDDEGSA